MQEELEGRDAEIEQLKKKTAELLQSNQTLIEKCTKLQVKYSEDTLALSKAKEELVRQIGKVISTI